MKTVLLTGVTGYLGRHLLVMLLQENFECIGLVRSASNLNCIAQLKNKIILCESDPASLEALFKTRKIDIIIHAATSYGRKNETLNEIIEANIILPLKILTLAHQYSTTLFINTDTALLPNTNTYSLSKAQFLAWGKLLNKERKLKFLNFKTQHMYGPGDDETKFTSFVMKACMRNDMEIALSEGSQKRDFVYIDDVVSAYQHILKINHDQFLTFTEFELGSGVATQIKEYVFLVHQLTQSKSILKFGAKPKRTTEKDYVADVSQLKNLGWEPQFDLKKGLQETLKKETEIALLDYRRMRVLGMQFSRSTVNTKKQFNAV